MKTSTSTTKIAWTDDTRLESIADEVTIYLDMFRVFMKNGSSNNMDSCLTVAVKRYRPGNRKSKISKKFTEPLEFV